MTPAHLGRLARLLEALHGKLPDLLKHPEPIFTTADEALVEKRLKRVKVSHRYPLSRVDGATTGKNRDSGEEALLFSGEQVVAPRNCRRKRPVTGFRVAAALEEVEALGDALENLRRRQQLSAGGGQLER